MSENNIPFISYAEPAIRQKNPDGHCLTIVWLKDSIILGLSEVSAGKLIRIEGFKTNTWKVTRGMEKIPELINAYLEKSTKTNIIIGTPYASVLIPTSIYDENDREKYIDFVLPDSEDQIIFTNHLMGKEIVSLFTLDKKTANYLNSVFDFPGITHTSTILIEAIYTTYKNHLKDNQLFIHLLEDVIEVVHFREKRLFFYNQFIFKSKEDFIYYLLFVSEQLGLNPETVELIMAGDISEDSILLPLTEKYIRNVFLMQRKSALRLGPVLQQIPEFQQVLLINQDLCES